MAVRWSASPFLSKFAVEGNATRLHLGTRAVSSPPNPSKALAIRAKLYAMGNFFEGTPQLIYRNRLRGAGASISYVYDLK